MNNTRSQSAARTVCDAAASDCPVESSSVIVTVSWGGPGLPNTSSTSIATSLGSEGVNVCRTSLTKFVHALVHVAVFAWSGVMDVCGNDVGTDAGTEAAAGRCLQEEAATAMQQRLAAVARM